MTINYTNEHTFSGLDDTERANLERRIAELLDNWEGEDIDLENLRYVGEFRFMGMTFSVEVQGADSFAFDEDGSFTGIAEDADVDVTRIG